MPAPTFAIATFANAKDNAPQPRRISWPGLCASLTRFRVLDTDDKTNLPAWSPTDYPAGAVRRAGAVRALSCLVLDFDDGTEIEAARAPWLDWPHIVHTTWSHTEDAPHFRVVVPLASPVPARSWPRVWHWAHARAERVADPKCKDPGRLYFVPAVRSRTWPRWARAYDPGGWMLEVPATLPPTPEEVEAERRMRVASQRRPVQARWGTPDSVQRRIKTNELKQNPAARRAACEAMGGRVCGDGDKERAQDMPCPRCGRMSVWWPIVPSGTPRAMCHHRNSCGWAAWLDQYLEGVAA